MKAKMGLHKGTLAVEQLNAVETDMRASDTPNIILVESDGA